MCHNIVGVLFHRRSVFSQRGGIGGYTLQLVFLVYVYLLYPVDGFLYSCTATSLMSLKNYSCVASPCRLDKGRAPHL